jgi:hypothetical protein
VAYVGGMDRDNLLEDTHGNVSRLPILDEFEIVELDGNIGLPSTETGRTLARIGDRERNSRRDIVEESAHNALLSGQKADQQFEALSDD